MPAAPGNADHSDGIYELPAIAQWTKTRLNVLVVPPTHGQIWNEDQAFLNGMDPKELTPFNSYLKAIEDSIAAWKSAVDTFASEAIKKAYETKVYVLGRDPLPPDVLTNPDILVFTDESQATILGVAIRAVPCLVRVSKIEIESFSYADMFNVMGQEFGHCLGLQHVGSQGGVDPTSDLKHPEHDVMNGFYTHWVGEKGTHLHCISNLDVLALEYVFSTRNPSIAPSGGPSRTTYMPVRAYGTTCEPPPPDWRSIATGGSVPAPTPDPQTSQSPQPSPSDSNAPSPTPSPSPSPTPTQEGSPSENQATTVIRTPADGAALPKRSFSGIEGTAADLPNDARVRVALAKRTRSGGCAWWVQRSERFVSGPCSAPRWNAASGRGKWTLPIETLVPAGRYRAMSIARWSDGTEDCCHRGTNLIQFRIF